MPPLADQLRRACSARGQRNGWPRERCARQSAAAGPADRYPTDWSSPLAFHRVRHLLGLIHDLLHMGRIGWRVDYLVRDVVLEPVLENAATWPAAGVTRASDGSGATSVLSLPLAPG